MTHPHSWVVLITVLTLMVYVGFALNVATTRNKAGVHPPAMTGDPRVERALRVQANMLEWLPVFLVGLWLFAIYWNNYVAAALGLVWIAARIGYGISYMAEPGRRVPWFGIQALCALILLIGGGVGAVRALVLVGA